MKRVVETMEWRFRSGGTGRNYVLYNIAKYKKWTTEGTSKRADGLD